LWVSVGDSVWDSVGGSVWGSVWGYTGSFFPGIKKWKYVDYKKLGIKPGRYPFEPVVKLWKMGIVPAYAGKHWYLLVRDKTYKKSKIVWKGKLVKGKWKPAHKEDKTNGKN